MVNEQWSNWRKITEKTEYCEPAVYEIRLVKKGKVLTINRFGGKDKTGTLCIGETGNMNRRLKQFKSAMETGKGKHSEGNLLFKIKKDSKCYKKAEYQYHFLEVKSKEVAKEKEDELIENYLTKYCEAPPLNSNIPHRISKKK